MTTAELLHRTIALWRDIVDRPQARPDYGDALDGILVLRQRIRDGGALPDVAASNYLAALLDSAGYNDEAMEWLEDVSAALAAANSSDAGFPYAESQASVLNQLGLLAAHRPGRRAVEYFEQALREFESGLPALWVARLRTNLAAALLFQGRADEAALWVERAAEASAAAEVDSAQPAQPAQPAQSAESALALASVRVGIARYRADAAQLRDAVGHLAAATARRIEELAPDDPRCLMLTGDLAAARLAVARADHSPDRVDAVMDVLRIVAFRLAAHLGVEDPRTLSADTRAAIAEFELARERGGPARIDYAAERLKTLQDRAERVLADPANPLVLTLGAHTALADMEVARTRLSAAVHALRGQVTHIEQRLGQRHELAVTMAAKLAAAELELAQSQRSEAQLDRAKVQLAAIGERLEMMVGENHPLTVSTQANLRFGQRPAVRAEAGELVAADMLAATGRQQRPSVWLLSYGALRRAAYPLTREVSDEDKLRDAAERYLAAQSSSWHDSEDVRPFENIGVPLAGAREQPDAPVAAGQAILYARDAAEAFLDMARRHLAYGEPSKAIRALEENRSWLLTVAKHGADVEAQQVDPPGPPGISEIQSALTTLEADTLIYLVPARARGKGWAVVLPSQGAPSILPLPDREIAADAFSALVATAATNVESYADSLDIDNVSRWAWDMAMGPIAALLQLRPPNPASKPRRVVLVPIAELARVPWHAARDDDGRYLVESVACSLAVSGRALCESAAATPVRPVPIGMVVSDPEVPGMFGELPGSRFEAFAIHQAFYRGGRYLGRRADGTASPAGRGTTSEVEEWLASPHPGAVLHLACPGLEAQRRSYLALARSGLTSQQIMTLMAGGSDRGISLAVLTNSQVPTDEAFSLATAFHLGGVRSVVSTLWPVPQDTTTVFAFMFHHYVRSEMLPAWEALHRTRLWMLDPHREVPDSMPSPLRRRFEADAAPGIEAWAGFVHRGH